MTDINETTENSAIEASFVVQGTIDNGQMHEVVFSFYSGPAGVRDRGDGRVEFAYFRAPPLSRWRPPSGDGTIGGDSYRVVKGQISGTTPFMAVVTADKL
jgi:hypothetical protein